MTATSGDRRWLVVVAALASALLLLVWRLTPHPSPRTPEVAAEPREVPGVATLAEASGGSGPTAIESAVPRATRALSVRVVACDGAPRADVVVEVLRRGASIASATSDGDGVARFDALDVVEEALLFRIREPVRVEREIAGDATDVVELVLAPRGTFLRGVVRSTDGSRGPWKIACIPFAAWEPNPASPIDLLARDDVRRTETDACGRFQLCDLIPGAYFVAVGADGRRPTAPARLVDTPHTQFLAVEVVPVFAVGIETTANDGAPLELSPLAGLMSRGVSVDEIDGLEHAMLDPIQSCLAGRCDARSSNIDWITFVARDAPPAEPVRARFDVHAWGYRETSIELPIARLDLAEVHRVELESLAQRRGRLVIDWLGAPACTKPAARRFESSLELVLKPDRAIDRREWRFHLDLAEPRSTVIDGLPFGSYRARIDGPGRPGGELPLDGGELPLDGGAFELTIGADDVHWSIDLSNTGCVRFVPRREDGSTRDGPLRVWFVRARRPSGGTSGWLRTLGGPDYAVNAVPAGELELRIDGPSEMRSREFTMIVRAGKETVVELGPGGPIDRAAIPTSAAPR